MIVQCEQCSTRFKLDDARVKDEGVRVRCSKCRHIFVVRKESAEATDEPDFDALLNGLVSGAGAAPDLQGEDIPEASEKPVPEQIPGVGTDEDSEQATSSSQVISTTPLYDQVAEQNQPDRMTSEDLPDSDKVAAEPDTKKIEDIVPSRNFPDISADEPPLPSIANRKLPGSRLPLALTIISVLVVIALAVAGWFFMNNGPAVINTPAIGPMAKSTGGEKSQAGGVSIQNAVGEFLVNIDAGELFVIKGEVVNAGSKPTGSIQLKATLYDAKSVALTSRKVYCGNLLTNDQLTTLSLKKLEAVMGNHSGNTLSNNGLLPGNAARFIVVFSSVPKDTAEFGLEVVGSEAASQ